MTPYERTGAALADATHIFIAAGAGASADSGMLVFSQGAKHIRRPRPQTFQTPPIYV